MALLCRILLVWCYIQLNLLRMCLLKNKSLVLSCYQKLVYAIKCIITLLVIEFFMMFTSVLCFHNDGIIFKEEIEAICTSVVLYENNKGITND